jgi:Signal peptide peptidase
MLTAHTHAQAYVRGHIRAHLLAQVADKEKRQRDSTQGSTEGDDSDCMGSSETASAGADVVGSPASDAVLLQRPYFSRVVVAHVAGLLAAFGANAVTHLGQPALLYIVPSTLAAVAGTAASRREFARVANFTDVPSFGLAATLDSADKTPQPPRS